MKSHVSLEQPDRVAELDQAVGSGRNMYYAGQHDAEEPADAADRLALVAERDELTAEVERLRAALSGLLEFAEEVRRSGDTRLASMAIAVIAKATGKEAKS